MPCLLYTVLERNIIGSIITVAPSTHVFSGNEMVCTIWIIIIRAKTVVLRLQSAISRNPKAPKESPLAIAWYVLIQIRQTTDSEINCGKAERIMILSMNIYFLRHTEQMGSYNTFSENYKQVLSKN